MSCFGYSENYVWFTTSALGEGGFGTVYLGNHKGTGEEVAVKTFKDDTHGAGISVTEFEVTKYLNHENIVKMLVLEDECGKEHSMKKKNLIDSTDGDTKSTTSLDQDSTPAITEVQDPPKVLIMELCRGGNLQKVLEDPQNVNGLEEKEFLCVLKDITAGLKYLRDNKIVHRDIKPGNIMKYISEDGRCIYKVADFGSARYLEDDQEYYSIHGTVPYQNPNVLDARYLHQEGKKAFTASTELWSIGVTIYQLATGSLPFRPFSGRQNRRTMHHILSQKPSGVISGIQHGGNNQPIEWSKELPKTCLLNQGLRDIVTVLLVRIFECNPEKMLTFDEFFESVSDIISRKIFHVFYVNERKEVSLYMQPAKKLQDLKDKIFTHTEVCLSSELLFDKSLFEPQIDPSSDVSKFPMTTLDKPIILVHMENIGMKDLTTHETVSSFTLQFPSSLINVNSDASVAQKCCSKAYAVKRSIAKLKRCQELLLQIPKILISLLADNISRLCSDLKVLKLKIDAVSDKSELLEKISSVVLKIIKITWKNPDNNVRNICGRIESNVSEKRKSVDKVKKNFAELESSTGRMKEQILKDLQCKYEQTLSECSSLDSCVELANTYVGKIRDSWQQVFIRHKTKREFFDEDNQIHKLGRLKMQNMNSKLYTLLLDECWNTHLQTLHKLNDWYSGVQTNIRECKYLKENLRSVRCDLAKCSSSLQQFESQLLEHATQTIVAITSFERYTGQDEEILENIEAFRKRQQDLGDVTDENKLLIEKFASLLQNAHEDIDKL